MDERIQGDRYLIGTKIGDFEIVAAELETTYDEKQHCDYAQAFDQYGQVIAYFKNVVFWLLVDGNQKMLYKTTNQE